MTRLHGTTIVGREKELQELITFARSALAGNAGVAFVTGETGIGKTALIEELLRRLRTENERLVIASGRSIDEPGSYRPFCSLMEDLLGGITEESLSGKSSTDKYHDVQTAIAEAIRATEVDLTDIFFPDAHIHTVLDSILPERTQTPSPLDAHDRLEQIQEFGWFTQVVKNLSRQFPLLLFFDDLDRADSSSLELFRYLGHETEHDQMFIIATYRPHKSTSASLLQHIKRAAGEWLPIDTTSSDKTPSEVSLTQLNTSLKRHGAKEFPLKSPVSEEMTVTFVHDYLTAIYGTRFPVWFEQELVQITGGNSLFLKETLLDFQERGQFKQYPPDCPVEPQFSNGKELKEGWRLPTELEYLRQFPETVEQVINRRLRRLDDALRNILDYASIQGDDFIVEAIPEAVQEQIDALSHKQFIREGTPQLLPNGTRIRTYTFRHHLIRECLSARISSDKNVQIHKEFGAYLEHLYASNPDEMLPRFIRHFYYGRVPGKSVQYCLQAAQQANVRHGSPEALQFAMMGLNVLEEYAHKFPEKAYVENRWRLLLELANAEAAGGDQDPQKDHVRLGIAWLDEHLPIVDITNDELYADVYARLGRLYLRQEEHPQEAREYLEEALYLYEQNDKQRKMIGVLCQLAEILPVEQGVNTLERCLTLAEVLHDPALHLKCLERVTFKYLEQDFAKVEAFAQQALQRSSRLGHADGHLRMKALSLMASVCRENGQFQTGMDYLKDALIIARRRGDLLLESAILNDLGFDYGRFVTRQEYAQKLLEQSIAIRQRAGLSQSAPLCNLGWIFTRRGKWREAEQCFRDSVEAWDEHEMAAYRGNLGELYEIQENYAQAELEFRYRLEVLEKYQRTHHLFGYTELARDYALSGNAEQSRRYLNVAQSLFEQETLPRRKWWCAYELADGHRMLDEFEEANAFCQQSLNWFLTQTEHADDLIYLAGARLVMGKILVEMGDAQKALPYLNTARAAFDRCRHYALGETLLYLGKASQALENPDQAKEHISKALTEFQRLGLQQKEHEAKSMLDQI